MAHGAGFAAFCDSDGAVLGFGFSLPAPACVVCCSLLCDKLTKIVRTAFD